MKQNYSNYGKRVFIRIAKDWFLRLNLMEVLPEDRCPIFNKLYKYRHIRQKHINAPLLSERVMYLEYREKYGAPFNTLIFFSSYLLVIIKYLRLNTCRSVTKAEIDAAAARWAFDQKRKGLIKREELHFSKKSFISLSTHWLKMIECLESAPCPPYEDMINRYVEYSNERGLQKTTIKVWTLKIRDFLSMVYQSGYHLETCTPATIDMLLTKKYQKSGYKRISIKNYATAIRNFLYYAGHAGLCCPSLSAMVESPRIYSHEGLPSYPHWKDVKQLLENTRTDKAIDIRDYAILLLLSIYGLRSSEVAHLKFKNINWNKECIHIQRAKNGIVQIFPLVQSVGEAIIRYLKNVRPNSCELQEIFVCSRAPYRPIQPGSIHTIVHNRLKPLNLNIGHHGAHALRHGCATHLMNEGFTLKEISSHLGHKNLESTRVYAKVDLTSLRKVADIDWSVVL